jgi:hypothetical protein
MTAVTVEQWDELVAAYEAAGVKSDQALEISEADGPGEPGSAADLHYEACWAAFGAAEDELLSAVAPTADALIYQLRVFAERFHQADLTVAETAGEDRPAGEFLRCILAGVERVTRRCPVGLTSRLSPR